MSKMMLVWICILQNSIVHVGIQIHWKLLSRSCVSDMCLGSALQLLWALEDHTQFSHARSCSAFFSHIEAPRACSIFQSHLDCFIALAVAPIRHGRVVTSNYDVGVMRATTSHAWTMRRDLLQPWMTYLHPPNRSECLDMHNKGF